MEQTPPIIIPRTNSFKLQRGFQQKMKMISHQNSIIYLNVFNSLGPGQYFYECLTVSIVSKDVPPLIAPAGDLIYRSGILDAQRSDLGILSSN
jgi:hypothetical protein